MLTTPPLASRAYPLIGHIVEMIRDRESLFKRGYQEHGDVFSIKLGPQMAAVVTGAEYNRTFYQETDKSLNMQEGYAFLKEAIGEILFTANVEDYYNQRPVLHTVFKRERMVDYIKAMNIEVQRWLDSLGDSGEVNMADAMLMMAQFVAGRAFIGPDFREELGDQFWKEYEAIGASLDVILPPTLPLPKFKRRDQAKKRIHEKLQTLIEKRKQNPEKYDDLISTLLTTPLKDGSYLEEEKIVTMFMGLIFAGHETTAGQAGWLIALLLQNPDYEKLVRQEIQEQLTYGQPLDAAVLSKLEHIYWAIDETTRLRPSADTQVRTVTESIEIGGYIIPAGWRLMVSSASSHFLEDVFSQPQDFNPLRYAPDQAEGKNPFAIVGFGGGIHKCIGMNFAKNEMAIIVGLLFQQYDLELISEDIKVVTGAGANRPSDVIVRYKRKALKDLTSEATIKEALEGGCPHVQQHAQESV